MRLVSVILAFAILTFAAVNLSAADYEFSAKISKGGVVKKSGSGDWSPVKNGDQLTYDETIKLPDGAYLGLMHKTGRIKELTRSGEYKVADLSSEIASEKSSSMAARFADYVASEAASADAGGENGAFNKHMRVSGSVTRSGVGTSGNKIVLKCPMRVNFISDDLQFDWSNNDANSYKVEITDRFGEVVAETESNSSSIRFSAGDYDLKPGEFYFLAVSDPDGADKSNQVCFQLLDAESKSEVNSNLEELTEEIGDEETALKHAILGAFYEKNALIEDAATHYAKAAALAPNVESYKNLYTNFRFRNNLE